MDIPGPVYALATAFCWSFAVVLFKKSGDSIDPIGLNIFKNIIGLVLFGVSYIIVGSAPEASRLDYLALAASGAVGIALADSMFFACLNRLGAGRAAIVECAYSPFIVLFSYLVLGESLSINAIFGAVMIVSAVLLTLNFRGAQGLPQKQLVTGTLLGIGAMASMGLAIVSVKPILDRSPVLWATLIRMGGGVFGLLVWAMFSRRARKSFVLAFLPQSAWRYAIPGSIIGTYISLFLWIAGFKYNPANVASILNQTASVFTVVLAAIFLKDRLTPKRAFAVAVAFAGSVLVLI